VQAPDANPLASRASEPEARVEGSSFHAKPRGCAPAGNLTAPTKLACEPVHSSPKCQVHIRWRNPAVWRGTSPARLMSSRRRLACLSFRGRPYPFHRRHFVVSCTHHPAVIPGPAQLHRVGTRDRFGLPKNKRPHPKVQPLGSPRSWPERCSGILTSTMRAKPGASTFSENGFHFGISREMRADTPW